MTLAADVRNSTAEQGGCDQRALKKGVHATPKVLLPARPDVYPKV